MAILVSASASLVLGSSVLLLMLISPASSCAITIDCINSDMSLFPPNSLRNGQYVLEMEGCNLVLRGSKIPWYWETPGSGNCYLNFLSNGLLEIVSDADNKKWTNGKAGKPDLYVLKLLPEGRVVIIGSDQMELWSFQGSDSNRKLL